MIEICNALIVFGISYVIGTLIGILIANLYEEFKNWNREEWGVPKE